MATRVRSYSKVNLGLAVGPARADGFHALTTVYQTLQMHDFVTVTAHPAAETTILLTANHRGVPRTEAKNAEKNTAWKMVHRALERLNITAEVEIFIDKRLPVQGGMGAGSANAIAALLGLERELGVALSGPDRLELAAEVGSDVPLFLLGGTVLGLGRGEEVYPLPDSPAMPCVVALPEVGVSTALAFRELDAGWNKRMRAEIASDENAQLTSAQPVDKLKGLSRALASVWSTTGVESGPSGIAPMNRPELIPGDSPSGEASAKAVIKMQRDVRGDLAENPLLALVRTGIENDFEEVVFSQHPSLRSTKRDLMGSSSGSALHADLSGSALYAGLSGSALYAGLSGSGSALFGLYESQADACAAQYRVQQHGTRAILTETLPRRDYWHTMFAE
jgi:4-diphosphocytidyl-2-C-methyl-D-erythritol kinase